jgi:upstream activation factor subunit UAF30
MERFDKFQSRSVAAAPEPAPTANGTKFKTENHAGSVSSPPTGHKRKASSDDDLSDVKDDSPVPKKVKKSKGPKPDEVESDEQIAARLQAEFNAQTSSRATRGGGTKRKTPAKKVTKTKKKSAAKVGAEDDSDLEGTSGAEKPEKEKKGGFHVCLKTTPLIRALTC